MTLEEMVGRQLAVSLPGPDAPPAVIEALKQTQARSLVIFSRNFTSVAQFTGLLKRLRDELGYSPLILLDHEGGRVVRFSEGVTRFPSALECGRGYRLEEIIRQGAIEAEELRRLGVHVNLAPCADVLVEGADPVIGDRSYGGDPACVAKCVVARIQGLQGGGVAACAKHFPGLGAVPRDPHRILPTIHLGWDAMERVHLVSFQRAITAGVASIMSSHVCYPALGEPPGLPATFSRLLIAGLLRDRCGFQGVMMSDDLEMGALRRFGTAGDAAVRAVAAGHDLVLICSGDLAVAEAAAATLVQAYRTGHLERSALDASLERLGRLENNFSSRS